MVKKPDIEHVPSDDSVTEPESEIEQTCPSTPTTTHPRTKFYPGKFRPTTHISPALQPAKPLNVSPNRKMLPKDIAREPRNPLKREATSSPKLDDKENIPPRSSKYQRIEGPPSNLSSEVRSLRYVMEEMVVGQRELLKELKRIGHINEDGLSRLNSMIDKKL
ncbi:hypothetical protein M422DRAFT_262225 [Sphaerobolus stellatus SS14]|uniref:Uncharacterized protein n=1 Tax=Sphaerobolus stellatus (strain SS14) TaxID=990650 RepID=A0A0C9VD36_SPHS4|nr:hypothetical protein M422DRAFT_262225 [Sphaerobolus stellatus SS14]